MTGKMEDKGGRTEVKDKGGRRWRKGVENGGGRRYDRGRHNIFHYGGNSQLLHLPHQAP